MGPCFSTALLALNHVAGTVSFATSDDERIMFLVFGALQLLALTVLLAHYRLRQQVSSRWAEAWAWPGRIVQNEP